MKKIKIKQVVLVYQGGIANVFRVDCFNQAYFGREAHRLMQGDFKSCEWYCRGLVDCGVLVTSMACQETGDISDSRWETDLHIQPFFSSMVPIYSPTMAYKGE